MFQYKRDVNYVNIHNHNLHCNTHHVSFEGLILFSNYDFSTDLTILITLTAFLINIVPKVTRRTITMICIGNIWTITFAISSWTNQHFSLITFATSFTKILVTQF